MNYASWLTRVATNTIDGLVVVPFFVAAEFLDTPGAPRVVAMVVGVASLALFAYDRWYLAGRTGQSWGRKVLGVRLVDDRTGRPIGVGRAVLRDVAHLLDGALLCLGYLLPLVTAKRQTIGDKVSRTVVVKDLPVAEPAPSRA
ncbi:RDD family protein [Actinoplanes sp. NPDC051494]|uniref:RDD family protein n=1 Tax=Actinoplanes sp. NPDC051494 TaxID=3363907 RepID=UPI0037AB8719